MRATKSAIPASVGSCGLETQRQTWLRLHWDMPCALGKSTAIALTNKLSCGSNHACELLSSLSDGATSSRWSTIIWCWHAMWWNLSAVHGKARSARRRPNRCDTGSTNCCHVWELLPIPPNLAENRKAAASGHPFARQRGFQSSARGQNCLQLFLRDHSTRILLGALSFYGTSYEVLAESFSLNVNPS